MKNLAIAFIEKELIKTTVPKAKELRSFVEPLITMAKDDSVANRRRAFNKLRLDSAVNKLFTEISIKSKDRPGGYVRILKCGYRAGDNAPLAFVQLVDFKEDLKAEEPAPKAKAKKASVEKKTKTPEEAKKKA